MGTFFQKSGNVAMAELLIENGSDVDFRDSNGVTLLQRAVQSGNDFFSRVKEWNTCYKNISILCV